METLQRPMRLLARVKRKQTNNLVRHPSHPQTGAQNKDYNTEQHTINISVPLWAEI